MGFFSSEKFEAIWNWKYEFRIARAHRQAALLWSLAIASERQLPLAHMLHAFANDERGWWGEQVHELGNKLNSGVPLPDALDQLPGLLPYDAVMAARVGWESGTLGQTLRVAAARFTEQQKSGPGTAGGVIVYLACLLTVVTSIVSFLMVYIIPKFKKIFDDFGTELPGLTRFVIKASDFAVNYSFVILPLLALMVVGLLRFSSERGAGSGAGMGPWILLSRFAPRLHAPNVLRHLAVVVEAGRPMSGAIATLAKAHSVRSVRRRLAQVGKQLDEGIDCWSALREAGLVESADALVLESAERAGNLPWALTNSADRIERRLRHRFGVLSEFLRPAIIVGIAVCVGTVVIGMFMPLVKLINDLS